MFATVNNIVGGKHISLFPSCRKTRKTERQSIYVPKGLSKKNKAGPLSLSQLSKSHHHWHIRIFNLNLSAQQHTRILTAIF